jgi:hypothetical protein
MQASHAVQEKTACLCCGSLQKGQNGKQQKELDEVCPRNKLVCMFGFSKSLSQSASFVCFKHGTRAVESVGQRSYWNAVASSQSG